MKPNLSISIKPTSENYQVIEFNGEFDKAGHRDIQEELDNFVKNYEGNSLIFDFTGLKFINSEGIGYLMEIHTHLVNKDKKLVIIGLNSHVLDVFNTIGINEIIPVYDDLSAFLN